MFEKTVRKNLLESLNKLECGELYLTTPENETIYTKGEKQGPTADLKLKDWRTVVNLQLKSDIGFAADYRDGYWETSDFKSLILLGLVNEEAFGQYMKPNFLFKLLQKLGYLTKRNSIKQSKKNIYDHYDLGNDFYSLWLDKTMTYSSAMYKNQDETLEQAQINKYKNIIDKFDRKNGSIIEVGCGWGGFAETALNTGDYTLKGITLSTEQHDYATKRLAGKKADIVIEDYRIQTGKYDYIVSIEMIEAVGREYWNTYFSKLKSLLKEDGKIVIQAIVIDDALFADYAKGTDMIRTFIFPGGFLPSMGQINLELDKVGLKCAGTESFAKDYAKTLDEWDRNFVNVEPELIKLGFDKRFQRMWRFYLNSCSAAFTHGRIDVVQLEIVHA
ncbi:class I SAM-dependent methyltransferase [Francisella philomiragia]|uniref:Cyclopropane-fatty-acyl-phospholipid synthase n=1 Tax=Francisella philomiragia subsp. philomiragia (strain ATCC 25017 / CCUG 19701 / FSC 153 / O\|nr:cyclopropane-fatty-acyl-phospholipid synthase family protein [Francisella philomiragia]AJI46440.1 methyltransferase domain protein [Francisella philomiragia]AJI49321.1 mycolic acid cyclopropane synthetase family protein [Francisella philomiragia]MBK2020682.1 class I SAM-dependent methyltransferase [Francisella philomiragia]MBK2030899.1 class I SAM-dependent methyltransferase [Francisella philomiragia]MBK2263443.1 class I SAM-dependent methyltransferase [Francisella philomiragia]